MAYTDTSLKGVDIKKVHLSELATAINTLASNAKKDSSIDLSKLTYNVIEEENVKALQTSVNTLEELFSGNCCQANCCQTCQTTLCQSCQGCQTCQSAGVSCQSSSCQGCQSCQTCQGCQLTYYYNNCDCNCECNCDCSDDSGSGP